ncbi:MAG: N-6 DNA methylase [Candidatus Thermoplasmatota archaeon]|nr:N-6 DNA methylase [Candidatus Thermoplasmatota archaeon]
MKDVEKNPLDYKINVKLIEKLISKYNKDKISGEITSKNESDTRSEYIDKLFEALGWNMGGDPDRNDKVNREENIGGKKSDYGFRINGIPKFFLEAKAIKLEDILFNTEFDKQVVNYAWLKGCSWGILTNFKQLAVYNADNGKPEWCFTLHPEEFLTKNGMNKLALISKVGFENNCLDEWAIENGHKPPKRPVDKQLLKDMIHFREILSKDIKKNYPNLKQEEIDETVQRILDRLIFIRNAEDRGYEPKELKEKFEMWATKEKGHLIKKVRELYKHYHEVYNSGLFGKENEVHIADQVDISDAVLREVIQGLYSPKGAYYSYNFAVLESDVLGLIYEQYLGNLLKQTPKRAKLESSKVHRKEQGIYYTPSYIVDYIVKNTVGEYIKSHTPEEIKNVKILDPACGSGSFLIRAYKELENYWIKNSDFAQLTLDSEEFYSKKVEILKNNIFGVDLDPKAVEISQLNLLLQISESKQRLPILQNNIKVGNSLIDDPTVSDRAFKWEDEFPEIIKGGGGFDIVVGNPPYVRIQNLEENEIYYFSNNYKSALKNYDIYLLFVEKSLKLLRKAGDLGFIIPSKFVNSDYGLGLRNIISESKTLHKFVDFKDIQIFADATNYTCLLFLKNVENEEFEYISPKSKKDFSIIEISNNENFLKYRLPSPIQSESWVLSNDKVSDLMKKLKSKGKPLGELTKSIFQGLTTSADPIYFVEVISESKETARIRNIKENQGSVIEKAILKRLLKGKDIRKWAIDWKGLYVVYPYFIRNGKASLIPLSEIKEKYPLAFGFFKHYEYQLKSRENHRLENQDDWHQYIYRKNLEKFERPKIITQVLSSSNTFALDEDGLYYFVGGGNAGGYGILLNDNNLDMYYFVLALLNSNVLEFYLKNISTPFRGGYFSYGKRFIEKMPIVIPKETIFDSISTLSKEQVKISKKMENLANTDERNLLEKELNENDRKLNLLIYDVYGLSKSEIRLIEDELCPLN